MVQAIHMKSFTTDGIPWNNFQESIKRVIVDMKHTHVSTIFEANNDNTI